MSGLPDLYFWEGGRLHCPVLSEQEIPIRVYGDDRRGAAPWYAHGEIAHAAFYLRGTKGQFLDGKGQLETAMMCAEAEPQERRLVLAGAFIHELGRSDGRVPGWLRGPPYQTIVDAESAVRKAFGERKWPWWHHAANALPHRLDALVILDDMRPCPRPSQYQLGLVFDMVVADLLAHFELRRIVLDLEGHHRLRVVE